MRVFFLAPQPFYQERGTPIAVRQLVRQLAERGWSIDLLTFHEGSDFVCPNVRQLRIPRLPGIKGVPPGLSFKKLVCDFVFFFKALRMSLGRRYDVVHAVEESVFMAVLLRFLTRTPYVYDMDSSLPEQVAMKSRFLRLFLPIFRWMESLAIRRACIVLTVCDALANLARQRDARQVLLLRDPPLTAPAQPIPHAAALPTPVPAKAIRFMYVGNFASYQGLDLLLAAFARFARNTTAAVLTVVGGTDLEVEKYQAKCRLLGLKERVTFAGAQPIARLNEWLGAADVLISPRTEGMNTPMKIYSYLQSGKAILATAVPAHTQVLTPEVALLVPPEPEKLAAGMARLAGDAHLRSQLGEHAARLARERFSPEAFRQTVAQFCRQLETSTAGRAPEPSSSV